MNKKFQIYIFLITLLIGFTFFLTSCHEQNQIRIRIKASDDSKEAQLLKEEIKDEVIALLKDNKSLDINYLVDYLNVSLSKKYQDITVVYTKETFPAKSINGKVIPSGTYPTILIKIKDGLGSNWWSVLYPEYFNISYESTDEIEYRSYFIDKY